jgi:DNA-directed RNA polymerase specialized sigma subunit
MPEFQPSPPIQQPPKAPYDDVEENAMIFDFQQQQTPEKFEALYNKFNTAIERGVTGRLGRSAIPKDAVKGQAIVAFDKALKSFQPGSGARFTTWLDRQFQPLNRYVRDHADIAHIPDNRSVHISKFRDTVISLTDQLGREPTSNEISDSMGFNLKQVTRLQKELKKDLLAEEGLESFLPTAQVDIIEDRARSMMMDMPAKEQLILEHQLGLYGKAKLTPNQIAKKLNIPLAKVRTGIVKIQAKWKEYYGDRPL